jgi:hypothetical protein
MDFFSKVFPDEELREYALGRLASFLSGDVSHEHFYIFTGSGSNGKSRPSSCSRPHSASTAASCDGAPDATACSRGFGAWGAPRTSHVSPCSQELRASA